jgi:hypothetical protein
LSQSNIALIGGAGMNHHLRNKNTEVFVTSIHGINHIIEDKWGEARELEMGEIRRTLLREYH